MSHDFRFFGHQPDDWVELFFRYELQFCREPTAEQQRTIAAIWRRTVLPLALLALSASACQRPAPRPEPATAAAAAPPQTCQQRVARLKRWAGTWDRLPIIAQPNKGLVLVSRPGTPPLLKRSLEVVVRVDRVMQGGEVVARGGAGLRAPLEGLATRLTRQLAKERIRLRFHQRTGGKRDDPLDRVHLLVDARATWGAVTAVTATARAAGVKVRHNAEESIQWMVAKLAGAAHSKKAPLSTWVQRVIKYQELMADGQGEGSQQVEGRSAHHQASESVSASSSASSSDSPSGSAGASADGPRGNRRVSSTSPAVATRARTTITRGS